MMRLRLQLVYWVLLSTSIISSTLLFLIVASENAQGGTIIGPRRNFVPRLEDNSSILEESESYKNSEPEISTTLRPKVTKNFQDSPPPIVGSFDIPNKNEESKVPDSIEILKESLTQQPNLSQGVSDGGQPVMVTLVDTASTLQNLADHVTTNADYNHPRSKSFVESNVSEIEKPSQEPETLLSGSTKILDVTTLLPTDSGNDTDDSHPEVLVVRAEKKTPDDHKKVFEATETITDAKLRKEDLDEVQQQQQETIIDSKTGKLELDKLKPSEAPVEEGSEPTKQHEDMPSFNEWAQKRLEEAEKKKNHPNASVQTAGTSSGRSTNNMRVRSKNYAAPDCGAKVVAANPESSSSRSILVSTRDEYMLNKCTNRVWFVVELCEAIQAKKIEIANFELFSSSPKEFTVFVSDRYPTRDWLIAGQFTARDERDIQNFPLKPQLFGKYIKLEFHSHYGSEHYCPISLFRAYGTSEFEVLETETESDGHGHHHHHRKEPTNQGQEGVEDPNGDDDDDEDEDAKLFEEDDDGKGGNIFVSAREAVLGIVRKAAQALIKTGPSKANNITKIQESIKGDVLKNSFETCITPKYSVECNNCTDHRLARVFQIVSCRFRYLESLLESRFVYEALANTHLCESLGYERKRIGRRCEFPASSRFLSLLFSPDYAIAMCNVLAAMEQRAPTNASTDRQINATMTDGVAEAARNSEVTNQTRVETNQTKIETPISQIKPTKTLSMESSPKLESSKSEINNQEVKQQNFENTEPLKTSSSKQEEDNASASQEQQTMQASISSSSSSKVSASLDATKVAQDNGSSDETKIESDGKIKQKVDIDDLKDPYTFDNIDFKDLDIGGDSNVVSEPKASTPQQKESVFLRLSNRIKALERNMSLSSQYLEELSKRYKKQVEEMQRSLERAVIAMGEESRKGEEREAKRNKEIASLKSDIKFITQTLENLLYEQNSWHIRFSTIFQHVVFVLVDVVLVMILLTYCHRTGDDLEYEDQEEDQRVVRMSRGKSYEIIKETVRKNKKPKHRRPSEIAAHISGPYNQLMIENGLVGQGSRRDKRRRRKKSSLIVRRSSSTKECRLDLNSLRTIASDSYLVSRRASTSGTTLQSIDNSFFNSSQPDPEFTPSSSLNNFNSSQYSKKIEEVNSSEMEDSKMENSEDSPENLLDTSKSEKKSFRQKISSPSFMKTAIGARIKRLSISGNDDSGPKKLGSLMELETTTNGHVEGSDESRSSSATPTKKKHNGIIKKNRLKFR